MLAREPNINGKKKIWVGQNLWHNKRKILETARLTTRIIFFKKINNNFNTREKREEGLKKTESGVYLKRPNYEDK